MICDFRPLSRCSVYCKQWDFLFVSFGDINAK
nr:MAG TPA: hypothetical protein [Caudoviricetes sp.]